LEILFQVQIHWLGNGLRLKIAGPLRLRLFLLRIGAFRCRGRNLDIRGVYRNTVDHGQPQAAKKARHQGADDPALFLRKRDNIIGLEGTDVVLCHGQLGDLHILRLQIAGHSCGAGQDDLS
ncbi:YraN family protein, partial [Dysosmobacter welbionis]